MDRTVEVATAVACVAIDEGAEIIGTAVGARFGNPKAGERAARTVVRPIGMVMCMKLLSDDLTGQQ